MSGSRGFFYLVPVRARLGLFLGVFLLFAPFSVLYDLARRQPASWADLAIWCAYSGLVAVGWAFAFLTDRLWVLWIVIPLSFLLPAFFGRQFYGGSALEAELLWKAIFATALFVASYVFFISFIAGEGARTLRLRTEIGLAEEIHERLVPPIDARIGRLELYGRSDPATEVGGDLLDVYERDGWVGVFVADVTGHGVTAGVLMGMIKSAIRMRLLASDSLAELVNDLNRVIHENTKPGLFATFACLRAGAAGPVEVALAGHHPILWWKRAERALVRVPNEQPPLGILEGFPYVAGTIEPASGDLLVLLTDGITEVFDDRGEELGEERVERLIAENAERPLAEIHARVLETARRHGSQEDDQTLLLARVG